MASETSEGTGGSSSSEATTPSSESVHAFNFSLKTVLVCLTGVALICALIIQQGQLAGTRAALSRYEDSLIPTSLAPNEFRVIKRVVMDTSHAKVISYRIESQSQYTATLKADGDSGSAVSRYDEQTGLHVTEATILIDHVDLTQGALKVAVQGYSVFPVPAEFVLDESLEVFDLEPVYDRKTEVELLRLQENVYKIQLK